MFLMCNVCVMCGVREVCGGCEWETKGIRKNKECEWSVVWCCVCVVCESNVSLPLHRRDHILFKTPHSSSLKRVHPFRKWQIDILELRTWQNHPYYRKPFPLLSYLKKERNGCGVGQWPCAFLFDGWEWGASEILFSVWGSKERLICTRRWDPEWPQRNADVTTSKGHWIFF